MNQLPSFWGFPWWKLWIAPEFWQTVATLRKQQEKYTNWSADQCVPLATSLYLSSRVLIIPTATREDFRDRAITLIHHGLKNAGGSAYARAFLNLLYAQMKFEEWMWERFDTNPARPQNYADEIFAVGFRCLRQSIKYALCVTDTDERERCRRQIAEVSAMYRQYLPSD